MKISTKGRYALRMMVDLAKKSLSFFNFFFERKKTGKQENRFSGYPVEILYCSFREVV